MHFDPSFKQKTVEIVNSTEIEKKHRIKTEMKCTQLFERNRRSSWEKNKLTYTHWQKYILSSYNSNWSDGVCVFFSLNKA